MTPELAIARLQIHQLSSHDILSLANYWLNQGIYSDALNDIFMQNGTDSNAAFPLFETAMQELGFASPTRIDAAKIVAKDTLQKMVSGEIEIAAGASFLYWDVYSEIVTEFPDGDYIGSNLGFDKIFSWYLQIGDARDNADNIHYTMQQSEQIELSILNHIKTESKKWLFKPT
jgi:hypothetical protein